MKFAAAIVLLVALACVADARPVGLRSLLSDEEDPVYCSHLDDKCPEHQECTALDKKVCKQVKACTKDRYGEDKCIYNEECFEYVCKDIPRYCEVSYDKEDECVTKYGKDLECKKLDKEECVYDKECKYVDTKFCLKYNQEQKCAKDRQVCKEYKQEKKCKQGKCTKYDKYGECTKYDEDDCEYVDTKDCKVYETVKGKCVYVNTTCKEYKQEEKCEDVKVCWTGKCVEVRKKGGYTAGK